MKLQFLLVATLLFSVTGLMGARQNAKKREPPPAKASPVPFALSAAQRLEEAQAWDKAEEQYLKIDKDASPADRQQALEGIARVHQQAELEKRKSALRAAESLAETKHWKEAEQVYTDLMKTDVSAQKLAAEGLKRLSPRFGNGRWSEWFDDMALNVGRLLLTLSVMLGLFFFTRATLKTRRTIQFLPFRTISDDTANKMAFWFERVLSDLRSPAPTLPLAPTLTSSLPFMELPGFSDQLPDFDLEIGGTKIPLQSFYNVFGKPKARISGTWYSGTSGAALATIEKRRGLDYIPFSFTARSISSAAGAAQDVDLQLFAYAVFIEAARLGHPGL